MILLRVIESSWMEIKLFEGDAVGVESDVYRSKAREVSIYRKRNG